MLLALLPVSCSVFEERDAEAYVPLVIRTSADVCTKGYVTADTLADVAGGKLYDSAYAAPYRDLHVTAQRRLSDGNEVMFEDAVFSWSAGVWHHDPVYYWPFGYEIDMMAWSAGTALPEGSVSFDRLDVTQGMTMKIDGDRTQDDIVFGYAGGAVSSEGAVDLTMYHSQAWLRMSVSCAEFMEGTIRLDSVVLSDIYTAGRLDVTCPYGYAEGRWDFRGAVARDVTMDDNMSVMGDTVTASPSRMDMLIPEQAMTSVVLHYTRLGAVPEPCVHEFALPLATWQMGRQYTYEISFSTKITVVPSVVDWGSENITTPI